MKNYARGIGALVLLTWVLIVVGGATRVFDAGMSCPDWPHCYGVWWPWPESTVVAAGHLEGYVVDGVRYTWWQVLLEWGHRLLAALVGFGLLAALVGSLWQPRKINVPLVSALVLLMIQIKLGAWTVWLGNVHWSVVLHLGNAMLFMGALVWLREVSRGASVLPAKPTKKAALTVGRTPWAAVAVTVGFALLVWVTMLVGAAVSSTHSGGVCGGLPDCLGSWMPSPKVDVSQHIHMQHRLLAVLVLVLSVVQMIVVKRLAPTLRPQAVGAHVMVWGQVLLGVLTLYSFSHYADFYYVLSVVHLGWGTLLWMVAVRLALSAVRGRG